MGWGPPVNSPDTPAAFSAYAPFKANATAPGVSNSSFLGWINQPMYSPWNCQQACNALNATGVKCNSYNTCERPLTCPPIDLSNPSPPLLPQPLFPNIGEREPR